MHAICRNLSAAIFCFGALLMMSSLTGVLVYAQTPPRVAHIPGINPGICSPGPGEKPWLNRNQTPECRTLEVIASMNLEEKLAELGGITGRSANKRLELISGGGADGPNGIASMGSGPPQARGRGVTAFANAVTLGATWNRKLAGLYGKALGEEFLGKGLNSILGLTINIMRTWRWGRNGETFRRNDRVLFLHPSMFPCFMEVIGPRHISKAGIKL